jgi:hypothetical protein
MLQVYIIIVALVAGLIGFSYIQHRTIQAKTREVQVLESRVKSADNSRKAARRAADAHKEAAQASDAAAAAAHKALDEALRGPAKDWGSTQVPSEVLDAL